MIKTTMSSGTILARDGKGYGYALLVQGDSENMFQCDASDELHVADRLFVSWLVDCIEQPKWDGRAIEGGTLKDSAGRYAHLFLFRDEQDALHVKRLFKGRAFDKKVAALPWRRLQVALAA